jgi:hypothetical protein
MIVHYFDQFGVGSSPLEDQAKLVVDPYTVISRQVALELFKAISRGHLKVSELMSSIEHIEFSASNGPGGLWNAPGCPGIFAIEDVFRGLVTEVEDHGRIY